MAFSFNDSRRNIVWQGFTLDWYGRAWNNHRLLEAFANSLMIAVLATSLATVIGTMLAIGLWRFRFPGKAAAEGLTVLPLVIPTTISDARCVGQGGVRTVRFRCSPNR